jgi:CheY-like chemotaxis protein
MRRVLEIGNCDYDHQNIAGLLRKHFDVEVTRAHRDAEAMVELARLPYDLVLVNRVFDEDGGDGLAFIRQLKQDPKLGRTPVMLISNYPESQKEAVAEGALPGFGKRVLHDPTTVTQLSEVLTS